MVKNLIKRELIMRTLIGSRALSQLRPDSIGIMHTPPNYVVEDGGIRVKRDNWMSVMYPEELDSAKSSVTLQSTDRHGILGEKPPDFQVSL